MKTNIQKLQEWAVNKIKTEYPDDIALLIAVEAQSVNNDGHSECFDYFIPATERGIELECTFIIGGVGHDLYHRSWERTERTANFDDGFSNGLGKAKIVYSRTPQDEKRFWDLRQKMFDNLNNKEFMYKKALIKLDHAMDLYRTLMFENELYKIRMAAGYIADYLSTAIAYLNGTYLGDMKQVSALDKLPDGYIQYLRIMYDTESADEFKNLAHLMISSVRRFVENNVSVKNQTKPVPDFNDLAGWYQEMALSWYRIAYYCDTGNFENAMYYACYLQNELLIIQEEFGLYDGDMNLLGYFNAKNLSPLKSRSIELQKYITNILRDKKIKIEQYGTVDDFLKCN